MALPPILERRSWCIQPVVRWCFAPWRKALFLVLPSLSYLPGRCPAIPTFIKKEKNYDQNSLLAKDRQHEHSIYSAQHPYPILHLRAFNQDVVFLITRDTMEYAARRGSVFLHSPHHLVCCDSNGDRAIPRCPFSLHSGAATVLGEEIFRRAHRCAYRHSPFCGWHRSPLCLRKTVSAGQVIGSHGDYFR